MYTIKVVVVDPFPQMPVVVITSLLEKEGLFLVTSVSSYLSACIVDHSEVLLPALDSN